MGVLWNDNSALHWWFNPLSCPPTVGWSTDTDASYTIQYKTEAGCRRYISDPTSHGYQVELPSCKQPVTDKKMICSVNIDVDIDSRRNNTCRETWFWLIPIQFCHMYMYINVSGPRTDIVMESWANAIRIYIERDIQRIPLFHDLTLNNG